MQKWIAAVVMFSISSFANAKEGTADHAFREIGTCENLLEGYPVMMIPMVKRAVKQTLYASFLAYATEESRSLFDNVTQNIISYRDQNGVTKSGMVVSPNESIALAFDKLSEAEREVLRYFPLGNDYASDAETNQLRKIVRENDKASDYWYCEVASSHSGVGEFANVYKEILQFAKSRPREGEFGSFDVKVNSCSARVSLGLRNRNHEPERWEGSRFYEVDISVKNIGRESKRPVAGSIFIVKDGVEYEYDTLVPVFADGYNFGSGRLNPLLTVRSKVVYRVPDDVNGEVFWGPGGGAPAGRLWCGYM